MLDPVTYQAVECCLVRRIPFAVWASPGSDVPNFCSAPSLVDSNKISGQEGFFICSFAQPFSQSHWIPMKLDAHQAVEFCQEIPPHASLAQTECAQATSKEEYLQSCSELIRRLKERGNAKTVLSTVQISEIPDVSIAEIFGHLMEAMPDTLRFCYFHPETGCWLGATPELLLSADEEHGHFSTMALAGTARHDSWDEKNMREHQVVVDFISNSLQAMNILPMITARKSLKYGDIYHLRTDITGNLANVSTESILDALSPTPALCGYPRETALQDICELEQSTRSCYGGYIGWHKGEKTEAYVNIRSAKFEPGHCIMHVGGGIMPDSDPEQEWEEVMMKKQVIMHAFFQ